ncbi:hypothetical protein [uncultured Hyphomicrobium sp.]|uniref:hypothetical protein n=1 Tax=uncultured Hyphomicrobium sp. TaxID=194373 RepID=UPI0025E0FAE2|nr:hypothetical protein [uncultured Hyphomicrobium sp.]
MKSDHIVLSTIALTAAVLPLGARSAGAAGAKEMSKDIIAVQIRKQGFECKNPESATRDPAASKPDDSAWILKCEGATYKVLLIPKMAAKVEKLPDEPQSTEQKH